MYHLFCSLHCNHNQNAVSVELIATIDWAKKRVRLNIFTSCNHVLQRRYLLFPSKISSRSYACIQILAAASTSSGLMMRMTNLSSAIRLLMSSLIPVKVILQILQTFLVAINFQCENLKSGFTFPAL